MSELQAADVEIEAQETASATEAEPASTGSDLAPDSPGEGEQNTPNDSNLAQEKAQQAINKQHRKFREEQRRANDLERRLKEFEDKHQAPIQDVNVPELPSQWDDDYEVKIKQREEAIMQKARFEALQLQRQESEVFAQREAERKQYDEAQQLQDKFSENGAKLGLDQQTLINSQNAIIDYGVTPEVASVLLNDPDGPLMAQYLAANPLELHDIVSAQSVNAGLLLAQVKAKTSALKPKPSSAPDPATTLSGGSKPPKKRGVKGTTYE